MAEIPNAAEDLRLETARLIIAHTNIVERVARPFTVEEVVQRMVDWDFSGTRAAAHWCQTAPGSRGMPPRCLVELLDFFGPAPAAAVQALNEAINHPQHYGGDTPYEAIKVMEAWHGPEAVYWFCLLSAEKYQSRMGKKPGEPMERDVKKAAWYMTYAAKMREKIEAKKENG